MSNTPIRGLAGRPKGSPNRNTTTVRLALNKMGFNAIEKYVMAYEELKDPTEKIEALKFLFKFVYPQFKEVDLSVQDLIDLENEDYNAIKPANLPTEKLLSSIVEVKDESK